jgi:hypothetical protein
MAKMAKKNTEPTTKTFYVCIKVQVEVPAKLSADVAVEQVIKEIDYQVAMSLHSYDEDGVKITDTEIVDTKEARTMKF